MINELQALTDDIGAVPKAPEMDADGAYSTHDYYQTFGSWNDALKAAGLDKQAALIDELERVGAAIGEIPSTTQIDERSRYSSGMYADEFGSITDARERAGFAKPERAQSSEQSSQTAEVTNKSTLESNSDPTQKALIKEIQRLDHTERLFPYAADMNSQGEYSAYDCQQMFGSWDEALAAAGIDKRARLLKELRHVRDVVEGAPKTIDMDHHGNVSASMYGNFFESWSDAISHIEESHSSASGNDSQNHGKSRSGSRSGGSTNIEGETLRWEDIPRSGRLPSQIAIQVKKRLRSQSDRVHDRYLVQDVDGTEFEIKIWDKHEIMVDWEPGAWYVLSEARGTVWESDGETKRLLDSTKDLVVEKYHASTEGVDR
ncbi:homing endonuclease associated repeat-containing protein [Halobacterium hubeiense]|uniref:homing endonuclease associated repeat-containing protein n=1 Tax=Halobacterium hubeiense TaxID=1407499 RepID=UPI003C74AD41